MFKQVSARIAAQQQASLFEGNAEDFVLVSQDKKGQDVAPAGVGPVDESVAPAGFKAVAAADPEKPCVGCAFWIVQPGRVWNSCGKPLQGSVGCSPFSRDDGQLVIFVKADPVAAVASAAGQAIEAAYPLGYRSGDSQP